MDKREARKCKECGYDVDYHDVFDDFGPSVFFVAMGLAEPDAGIPVATDKCPKCRTRLTLDSTTVIASFDHQPA